MGNIHGQPGKGILLSPAQAGSKAGLFVGKTRLCFSGDGAARVENP